MLKIEKEQRVSIRAARTVQIRSVWNIQLNVNLLRVSSRNRMQKIGYSDANREENECQLRVSKVTAKHSKVRTLNV
jgi:hypothetical protein